MANPIPILAIIMVTLTFEGLLFGAEIAERSFPSFEEPEGAGLFGAADAILSVIQGVWGAIVFFFNLVLFNVPGAPWYVQIPIGAIQGGGLVWAIASLFRGGGG